MRTPKVRNGSWLCCQPEVTWSQSQGGREHIPDVEANHRKDESIFLRWEPITGGKFVFGGLVPCEHIARRSLSTSMTDYQTPLGLGLADCFMLRAPMSSGA
eukprot:3985534-Pyramimonas_sp.AAC.1